MIAAMTQSMLLADEEETVWIIAQSNVAIKNVAEKLVKIGLTDFKLIVSHEFYFQWLDRYSSLWFPLTHKQA